MKTKRTFLKPLAFGATCALAAVASGCGAQQFTALATVQNAAAPGSLSIQPKVDVVLVEDDTGRIQDNYSEITSAITNAQNGLIPTLASQNWNYRFSTIRLTTFSPVTQALASTADPDWGSQWQPPFPGACAYGECPAGQNPVDQLPSNIFSTINYGQVLGVPQYNGFLQGGEANNSLEGQEPGFLTMLQNAQGAFTNSGGSNPAWPSGTGFLRPDALLAIVLVGTGNDTSYVNYCHRADGVSVPCEQVTSTVCTSLSQAQPTGYPIFPANAPGCGSQNLSFNYFLQQFQAMKPSPQQVVMYSAVASFDSASSGGYLCQGGEATAGTRYQNMALDMDGQTYDVCSEPLSTIIPNIAQNLTTTAMAYQQDYIVLSQKSQGQPDPSTIQVVESNGQTIPQSANNGWTYVGLTTQYLIDYPIPLNQETGYMIQLHGSAVLSGSTSASVTFKYVTGGSATVGN